MEKKKYSGRQFVLYGALALFVWAGYEAYVRLEDIIWWFKGMLNLCGRYNLPFFEAAQSFDASIFTLAAYLLSLALFAVAAIILRNRPMGDYAILVIALAEVAAGGQWANLFSLSILNWAQSLKLLPLILIIAGCAINISQFYVVKSRKRRDVTNGEKDVSDMDAGELHNMVKKMRTKKGKSAA